MSYFKVPKSIAKRIQSEQDLSDFYAYCEACYEMEDGEDEEHFLDRIPTYTWPVEEQDRIGDLDPDYTAGYYDRDNVKRIMGRYYNKEDKFLVEEWGVD